MVPDRDLWFEIESNYFDGRRFNMDELYDEALKVINKLFGDTSVSRSETKRRLRDLVGEIEVMLDALEHDEAKELDDDTD
jgi:hypothetical protein